MYNAARNNREMRFYTLNAKICREDTLRCAWDTVESNHGVSGIDRQSIADIITSREEHFLSCIGDDILAGRYRVKNIKRVYILKWNGRKRPLRIPVIKVRVVQAAVPLVI